MSSARMTEEEFEVINSPGSPERPGDEVSLIEDSLTDMRSRVAPSRFSSAEVLIGESPRLGLDVAGVGFDSQLANSIANREAELLADSQDVTDQMMLQPSALCANWPGYDDFAHLSPLDKLVPCEISKLMVGMILPIFTPGVKSFEDMTAKKIGAFNSFFQLTKIKGCVLHIHVISNRSNAPPRVHFNASKLKFMFTLDEDAYVQVFKELKAFTLAKDRDGVDLEPVFHKVQTGFSFTYSFGGPSMKATARDPSNPFNVPVSSTTVIRLREEETNKERVQMARWMALTFNSGDIICQSIFNLAFGPEGAPKKLNTVMVCTLNHMVNTRIRNFLEGLPAGKRIALLTGQFARPGSTYGLTDTISFDDFVTAGRSFIEAADQLSIDRNRELFINTVSFMKDVLVYVTFQTHDKVAQTRSGRPLWERILNEFVSQLYPTEYDAPIAPDPRFAKLVISHALFQYHLLISGERVITTIVQDTIDIFTLSLLPMRVKSPEVGGSLTVWMATWTLTDTSTILSASTAASLRTIAQEVKRGLGATPEKVGTPPAAGGGIYGGGEKPTKIPRQKGGKKRDGTIPVVAPTPVSGGKGAIINGVSYRAVCMKYLFHRLDTSLCPSDCQFDGKCRFQHIDGVTLMVTPKSLVVKALQKSSLQPAQLALYGAFLDKEYVRIGTPWCDL